MAALPTEFTVNLIDQPSGCATEDSVVSLIRNRGAIGRRKYGASMDRADLSPVEWLEHLQEELGDALQYAERAKRAANLLESARDIMEGLTDDHDLDSAKGWLEAYRRSLGDSGKAGKEQTPSEFEGDLFCPDCGGTARSLPGSFVCDNCKRSFPKTDYYVHRGDVKAAEIRTGAGS